ncbi:MULTISPECIES: hypothetical protein [Enterobacteriaceae]|uniref:Uncharacterized protein n=1 Tax=Mangrovibacter plantisponsor TaxID=451513 RepID=A0A317Q639_9ENTR|nr:hypothetical protein [Mangrovibacter plantisponsor]PWW12468.1 hypothetical protein DES37_10131 [Mangrovibacter plantisponsor]
MLSVIEFCEEISQKLKWLSGHMAECEWDIYIDMLSENYPAIRKELSEMREQFWNSDKVGTRVILYSDPSRKEHKFCNVDGVDQLKEEYTELYDPAQECWKQLKSRIFRVTFSHLIQEPFLIDDVFESHLFFASLTYQWGKSVMLENERVAIKAFIKSAELFDRCIGMSWFHVSVCTQKKLSLTRAKAGKKGGDSKAEVYRVIQDKLVYLINESVPEGGWKSKAAAVNTLIDPLWDFIKESNFDINNESKKYRIATMSQDALEDTIIKNWSRNIESVKLALDNTVTRKKKIN